MWWMWIFLLAFFPSSTWAILSTNMGWTQYSNTHLEDVGPSPIPPGAEGVAAMMDDWSGAALNRNKRQLIIAGGGHAGYAGNEIYVLDFSGTPQWIRINEPSSPVRDGCQFSGTYADGKPVARHSYNHLFYYEHNDSLYQWGGSMWECGSMAGDLRSFSMTTEAWTVRNTSSGPSANFGRAIKYHRRNRVAYARDDFFLKRYNPVTDTWATVSVSNGMSDYKHAVIDEDRDLYCMTSANSTTDIWCYDISNPTATNLTRVAHTTSGCTWVGNEKIGWAYDTVQKKSVIWNGGNNVQILDHTDWSCTTVTAYTGGPGSANPNGTYGRFDYSPRDNAFILCNFTDVNCYSLRLTAALSAAEQNWVDRVNTDGVVAWNGFDNTTSDIVTSGGGTNTFVNGSGNVRATLDTSVKTSGAGSLKFQLDQIATANIAGYLIEEFNDAFGANKTFYVQLRQRISPEMISNYGQWRAGAANTGWKSFIIYGDNGSCDNVEFTITRQVNGISPNTEARPLCYTECGQRVCTTAVDAFTYQSGTPHWFQQPQDTANPATAKGYNCAYQDHTDGTGNRDGCWSYPTDAWWTWYLKIQIGTFGTASSKVEGWVAADGGAYRQIWRIDNYTFQCNGTCDSADMFKRIQITPYMTALSVAGNDVAYTWYDEFIVSTTPIIVPGGSTSGTLLAPTGLSVN